MVYVAEMLFSVTHKKLKTSRSSLFSWFYPVQLKDCVLKLSHKEVEDLVDLSKALPLALRPETG